MAWRRPGDKPLSEPMMVSLLTHICVTRPQWVKSYHFYGTVFKFFCFFRLYSAYIETPYDSIIALCMLRGLYSLSGRTLYRKISWSVEATRFGLRLFQVDLKFDRHLGGSATEMPVKFQSDMTIITPHSFNKSEDWAVRLITLVNRSPVFGSVFINQQWRASENTDFENQISFLWRHISATLSQITNISSVCFFQQIVHDGQNWHLAHGKVCVSVFCINLWAWLCCHFHNDNVSCHDVANYRN